MSNERRADDTVYYTNEPRRSRNTYGWMWSLLLIPLFFLLGWGARSAYDSNATPDGVRYGVGGGPGDAIVSPTGYPNENRGGTVNGTGTVNPGVVNTIKPSATPVVDENFDENEGVEPTAAESPSPTPKKLVTPTETPTD